MPFGLICDTFHRHPKREHGSIEADGVLVRAISFSAEHLTDGFVRAEWLSDQLPPRARFIRRRRVLRDLTRPLPPNGNPILHRVDEGWLIHDYLDINRSREQVKADRAADAGRQRRLRNRRRELEEKAAQTPSGSHGVTPGSGSGEELKPTATAEQPEQHPPERAPNELAGTVAEVKRTLRQCSRFTVLDGPTDMQIENALLNHPDRDPIVAAREAVISGSDPTYRTTNAGRAFAYALQKLPPGKTRAEIAGQQDGGIPGQRPRGSDCEVCKGDGYVLAEDESNRAVPCPACRTGAAA